jgi:peptidoglycan-N-acetylglucosamine deacetylase
MVKKFAQIAALAAWLLLAASSASAQYSSALTPEEDSISIPETAAKQQIEFGSGKILESCWSPEGLAGRPADKRIRGDNRLLNPPPRLMPVNRLAPLKPSLQNSIRDVNPAGGKKIVALTFDLCERASEITGYDYEIVNYLRSNKIKATFFASGKWMLDHPEKIMQLMADPLFEVGNHAWTHDDLRVEKGIKMEDQVLWTQSQYELLWEQLRDRPCAKKTGEAEMEKIPKLPLVFRFPYGVCSHEALNYLAGLGLPAIQWSIVTGDPSKTVTADRIVAEVVREVKPGAIIICHANGFGHATAQALPEIFRQLTRMGYEFVTVTELLDSGPAFTTRDCYEQKPGDNYRYDKIFGKAK